VVFFAALGFYFLTMCPTIGFGDTALIIDAMMRAHLHSHVNNHPLSVGLGYLFTLLPFGSIAFRANLMSVVFGAATVTLLFACFRVQGVSRLVAFVAAAVAAVSHSLWWHSTIVENYAVSAALIAGCYLLLTLFQLSSDRRHLYAACVVAALGIFNHVQNAFLCVGVAVVGFAALYRAADRIKALALCAGCACIGLLPWLYLVLRETASPLGLRGALEGAFFGKFKDTFFSETIGRAVYEVAYLMWWQSPLGIMVIGAILGMLWYVKRFGVTAPFLGMVTHIVLTIGVFAGYATWDRFAFLLAGFVGLHYFAGLGLSSLVALMGKGRGTAVVVVWSCLTLLVGPAVYGEVVNRATDPLSVWRARYAGGYSAHLYNQAEYVANPNKGNYREVEVFANLLFDKLPPNSLFLDDDSRSYYPLADYFQRYLGKRRDISFLLVNSWGFSGWGLSSDSLSALVERAYYFDKPFFVASTGVPYQSFFNTIKKRIPVQFERFPLNADRWVYRLMTAKAGSREMSLEALSRKGVFKPIPVLGVRGEVNLTAAHVSFSASTGLQMQKMNGFGAAWLMDDQVFVPTTNAGGELEFVVQSDAIRNERLSLYVTKAPDFGDVRISLDGKSLGEFSLYAARPERARIDLGEVSLAPTGSVLSLKVIGKSDVSEGYKMGVDSMGFE
jgi:hypothetical protein